MTIASHLQELRRKHETLSDQVERAQRSPATDDLQIATMKKQKLKIKEEITPSQPGLAPVGAGACRQRRPPGDQKAAATRIVADGCVMPATTSASVDKQRRCVGRYAQKLDIALLHPDIPGEERNPHRPDAQAPESTASQVPMRARPSLPAPDARPAKAPPWPGRIPPRLPSAHRPTCATGPNRPPRSPRRGTQAPVPASASAVIPPALRSTISAAPAKARSAPDNMQPRQPFARKQARQQNDEAAARDRRSAPPPPPAPSAAPRNTGSDSRTAPPYRRHRPASRCPAAPHPRRAQAPRPRPIAPPMRKADRGQQEWRNGRRCRPSASARSDHIRMAVKPMIVARRRVMPPACQ